MTWQFKDPDEVADYQIDWAATLGTDTISTSNWVVPVGLTEGASPNTDTTATVWLSGGADGTRYDLVNTITTAAGRTFEQYITLFVRSNALADVLDATIGTATADSFVTEVEFLDYALNRGWVITESQGVSLRRAADALGRNYSFVGRKTFQTQALAWPRITSIIVDGFSVSSETIPQAIKDAQCELAYLIKGGLDPFATISSVDTAESIKVGPISIASQSLPTSKARLVAIEGLLRDYMDSGAGQIRLVRG